MPVLTLSNDEIRVLLDALKDRTVPKQDRDLHERVTRILDTIFVPPPPDDPIFGD